MIDWIFRRKKEGRQKRYLHPNQQELMVLPLLPPPVIQLLSIQVKRLIHSRIWGSKIHFALYFRTSSLFIYLYASVRAITFQRSRFSAFLQAMVNHVTRLKAQTLHWDILKGQLKTHINWDVEGG